MDFIPLARAAALAHSRLFPGHAVKDAKTLDLIALALSQVMTLYQRDEKSDQLHAVDAALVAAGRFTRGATTVEFTERPPLRYLVVSTEALPAAIDRVIEDSLLAAHVGASVSRAPTSTAR